MKTLVGKTLHDAQWAQVKRHIAGQWAWFHEDRQLQVIETVNEEADGRIWHHVSVSVTPEFGRRNPQDERPGGVSRGHEYKLPSWDDLKIVKTAFIGDDRTAYMVYPPRTQWVNDHPFVLHLWSCRDEDAILPDFRHIGPHGRLSI